MQIFIFLLKLLGRFGQQGYAVRLGTAQVNISAVEVIHGGKFQGGQIHHFQNVQRPFVQDLSFRREMDPVIPAHKQRLAQLFL